MTFVWCEFVCAACSTTSDGEFVSNGRIPIRWLKRKARGWVFKDGEAYCSKGCAEQRTADSD